MSRVAQGVEYGRGWRQMTEKVKRRYKIKWAIVTDKKYVMREKGKLAWTYDKAEAELWAQSIPGARVVDADDFVKEFNAAGEGTESQ